MYMCTYFHMYLFIYSTCLYTYKYIYIYVVVLSLRSATNAPTPRHCQMSSLPNVPYKTTLALTFEKYQWSSDTSQCDQCVNTKMVPQCALPAKCGASGIPPIFSSMSDGAGAILSPCLSTCFLSAVALVLHMI